MSAEARKDAEYESAIAGMTMHEAQAFQAHLLGGLMHSVSETRWRAVQRAERFASRDRQPAGYQAGGKS